MLNKSNVRSFSVFGSGEPPFCFRSILADWIVAADIAAATETAFEASTETAFETSTETAFEASTETAFEASTETTGFDEELEEEPKMLFAFSRFTSSRKVEIKCI